MRIETDVAVIGAGVTGAAIARELTRYNCKVVVIEKEEDVCSGTSKANSAIVHAGYDAKPGTLKAKLNVRGSEIMPKLAKELNFEFRRNGSLVLCFSREDLDDLRDLYLRGIENGVKDMQTLSGDAVRKLEPNISDEVVAAIYAPTGGIVCPFGLTIAMAENAVFNGAKFLLNTSVDNIVREDGYLLECTHTNQVIGKVPEGVIEVLSENGAASATTPVTVQAKYVVNAAGVYADVFHNMVSEEDDKLHIIPRRGEYVLLDKTAGKHVNCTIFQQPGKYGKGILVTPTVHGNLLVGPTATDQEDRDDTKTTAEGLDESMTKANLSVKNLPYRQIITSFAGLRAHEEKGDFVIGEVKGADGFFDAAGIESPGLSCAPAIGEMIARLVAEKGSFSRFSNWDGRRRSVVHAADLPLEERAKLIARNPDFGRIICRCEEVSEGEIMDAINRPLGARSMDSIKRRVRAGMGRCQAGFCTPRTMEILSEQAGIPMEKICKNREGSELIKY